MSYYIIRLDDACPMMNHENWDRMEQLLDLYGIKPIVGVIPDNSDKDFGWKLDEKFWDKVHIWKNKGWTLALHGLHHDLHWHEPGKGYFQKSHSTKTEFAGEPLEEQKRILTEGMEILKSKGIVPNCFFAPAHTYDANTVEALKDIPEIRFISDGYALFPYQKQEMTFLPSICDGPFKMPFGCYTFVFHPSMMTDASFERAETFFKENRKQIISTDEALKFVRKNQGIIGILMENGIFLLRRIRNALRK